MHPIISTVANPTNEDREAILQPLLASNEERGGPSGFYPVALLIRDPGTGKAVGGLWGRCSYDWLFVELIFVPKNLRGTGVGSELMRKAEAIASEREMIGIWLDTYEFQARGFYEKLGYTVFGMIDDHPRGMQRFFLRKRLR